MRQDVRLKATAPVIHALACVHESRRWIALGNRTLGAWDLFPTAAKKVLDPPAGAVDIAAIPSLPAHSVAVRGSIEWEIGAIRSPESVSRIRAGKRCPEVVSGLRDSLEHWAVSARKAGDLTRVSSSRFLFPFLRRAD